MRKLPRSALPFGLVAAASLVVIQPGTAQAACLNPYPFVLHREDNNDALGGITLPRVKNLSDVLDDANRTATRMTTPPGSVKGFAAGFFWEPGDTKTEEWYPQGITTSSDAYAEGTYEGRKVILVSWYDHTRTSPNKGVRVSFVDRSDPLQPKYRHVLLVVPYTADHFKGLHALWNDKHPDRPLHAGGMFWYGDLLYVADTDNGFRVFDLNDIMRVSPARACADTLGRLPNGSYCAYGYKYVLPQKFAYTAASGNDLRFSFVSLDRTTKPDSILVGEYDSAGKGTRLIRWSLDFRSRELTPFNQDTTPRACSFPSGQPAPPGRIATSDAIATWAYQVGIESMQGAASINNKFFITRSHGDEGRGDIITWTPGQNVKVHGGALPPGPEDLAYRASTDELWTVTEWPRYRMVVALTAKEL